MNRAEDKKLNQTTALLSFGWVFDVQFGLPHTQQLNNTERFFFFFREKENLFVKIFDDFRISVRELFFSFREKILKTARENINCVRENFFHITYVKMVTSVREKYN